MSEYSRRHARPIRRLPIAESVATLCVLLLCSAAFWMAGQTHGPVMVISHWLDAPKSGLGCGTLRMIWVGIVLLCALLLVAILVMMSPRALDLPQFYDATWAGIGEDVETAGAFDAVLRLAAVVAVLLLCAGLAHTALRDATADSPVCRGEPEDPKPPPNEPATPDLGGIVSQLDRIATSLAAPARPAAPELKGIETALNALAGAVQSLKGSSAGGEGAKPTDLTATDRALKDIAEAIAHAQPVQVAPPAAAPDLRGIESALNALAAAAQAQKGMSAGTGGAAPPTVAATDLTATDRALKDIAEAIAHAQPVQVPPPTAAPDLRGIESALNALAAAVQAQRGVSVGGGGVAATDLALKAIAEAIARLPQVQVPVEVPVQINVPVSPDRTVVLPPRPLAARRNRGRPGARAREPRHPNERPDPAPRRRPGDVPAAP